MRSRPTIERFLIGAGAILVPACAAGSKVKYVEGRCLIDGVAATLAQVELRQAEVTQHMLSRQPILTGIAVAAVVLASAGYVQRLLTILAARRAPAQNLGDRIRVRMERYRAHPVRYFLLLGGVLGLLVAAGAAYVSMDADKRTSERSLATLQFCHLALRSADEQRVLSEQREHLASIQSTEHDIRALVDQLPPAERDKAHEIEQQLSTTLGQQRALVAHFAEHADTAAKAVADHQVEVERGLSKLDDEVVDLKSLPAVIAKLAGDVHDVGAHTDSLGGAVEACNARLETMSKSLDVIAKQLDALAARPAMTAAPTAAPGPAGHAAEPTAAAPKAGSDAAAAPSRPRDVDAGL